MASCGIDYVIRLAPDEEQRDSRNGLNLLESAKLYQFPGGNIDVIIPPPNEVGGGVYWIHLVRPSVRPSVCLSVDDMVSGA